MLLRPMELILDITFNQTSKVDRAHFLEVEVGSWAKDAITPVQEDHKFLGGKVHESLPGYFDAGITKLGYMLS